METDPRIWFDPEIGHLCPPSRPLPQLLFLPCPFHSLLWDTVHHGHYRPQLIAHSCCSKKGPFLTPWRQPPIIQFGKKKRGERRPGHRALSVELLKFTLEFYAWAPAAVYDFQESTSSKWSLSDAELYDHRKAQMERQKTQVMQKQICLQMYLLTAAWQDLLFTILCKESECNQPPSPPKHTHAREHTHSAELGSLSGWWLVKLKIDLSHRRCRQMINILWVVWCARWEAAKPLTLQDLSSPCDSVRRVAEWRGAISELPAALYPHRKCWPVLILIPLMPLVFYAKHRRMKTW